MTRQFHARFVNGVIVPVEKVDLPTDSPFTLVVVELTPLASGDSLLKPFDDPDDPRPAGGLELHEWWKRHRIELPPGETDRIARSKQYEYYEEPDDEVG